MAKTAETIKRVPAECEKTINSYAALIHRANTESNERGRVEWAGKLRGYLGCLKDLGIFTVCDMRNLYLWVITGHTVGENAGAIK